MTLTLADTIYPGDTVKLSYAANNNPLEDGTGNDAAALTNELIENERKIKKPGPVQHLAATAVDAATIELDWDLPADTGGAAVTGYRVVGSNDGGGTTQILWSGRGAEADTTTAYTHDEDLEPDETWHYWVSAINAGGESEARRDSATTTGTPPGKPTGLDANANGSTIINLEWTAPADTGTSAITGYKIEVATDGTDWTVRVANTGDTTTSYEHRGLSPATTRHYRVSAINDTDAGEASDTAVATTGTGNPPGRPTNLTATADGQTAIDLDWTAPTDTGSSAITGYKIEVAKDAGSNWDSLDNTAATKTDYEHTGLSADTTLHYRVFAINGNGTSEASNIDSATTASPDDVPDPPTNLTATADGRTAIDLDWTAPANTGSGPITGYKIEVRDDAGSSWDSLDHTAATKTDYKHTGLSPDTTLHYQVRAINQAGASDPSNVDSATTESPGEAPDPPRNLEATADGQTAINLDWDAPSDHGSSRVVRYKIEELANGTSWDSIAGTDSTKTDYRRTGLSAGTTRHYRVFAINDDGTSEASDTASATTRAVGRAPSAPRNLTAIAEDSSTINLRWELPADSGSSAITAYRIEESEDNSTWTVLVDSTETTARTYERENLSPGDTRYYRVSAHNSDSTSVPSNVASATTESVRPGAPTNLQATAQDSSTIELTWVEPEEDGGSPITGYRIEWSPDGSRGWTNVIANTGSDATSYSDTGLNPNTTRHYRVSAINTKGDGRPSNVDDATTLAGKPGRPTNLGASARDTSQIDLTWRTPDDDGGAEITGYRIEWSDDRSSWVDLEVDTESDRNQPYRHQPAPGNHAALQGLRDQFGGHGTAVGWWPQRRPSMFRAHRGG